MEILASFVMTTIHKIWKTLIQLSVSECNLLWAYAVLLAHNDIHIYIVHTVLGCRSPSKYLSFMEQDGRSVYNLATTSIQKN